MVSRFGQLFKGKIETGERWKSKGNELGRIPVSEREREKERETWVISSKTGSFADYLPYRVRKQKRALAMYDHQNVFRLR